MRDLKIHFICRGNVLRGRLAELYALSLAVPGLEFSSSGIDAGKYYPVAAPVSDLISDLIAKYKLFAETDPNGTQTTESMLEESDLLVFLSTDVYKDAIARYRLNLYKCVVWDVLEWEQSKQKLQALTKGKSVTSEATAEMMFDQIKHKLRRLLNRVTDAPWVEIVDAQNEPQHFRLPIAWANKNHLWHRGCQALIITADKKCIVERHPSFSRITPGWLDVSVGGSLEDNESPEGSIIRHVNQELGLSVTSDMLRLMKVETWHYYHRRYRSRTNMFIYCYCLMLPVKHPKFMPEKDVVDKTWLLSMPSLLWLLRRHGLLALGRLHHTNIFYRELTRLAHGIEMPEGTSEEPAPGALTDAS